MPGAVLRSGHMSGNLRDPRSPRAPKRLRWFLYAQSSAGLVLMAAALLAFASRTRSLAPHMAHLCVPISGRSLMNLTGKMAANTAC